MRIFLSLLLLAGLSCGRLKQPSTLDFYSADSYQAEIEMRDFFRLPLSKFKSRYRAIDRVGDLSKADQKQLKESIRFQIKHLYGVFTYHKKPVDFETYPGAILESPQIRVEKLKLEGNYLYVKYSYRDKGIFFDELFDGEEVFEPQFYMPNAPYEIYKKTLPKNAKKDPKTKKPIHPCTEKYDFSEAAFWYYWSPDRKGCPVEFKKHLHLTKAKLTVLESTEKTYPEYKRLFEDKRLDIYLLVGQDEKFRNRKDLGRRAFDHMAKNLKMLRTDGNKPVFKTIRQAKNSLVLRYPTDQFEANVNLIYVNTETKRFDKFAKKSLKTADVVIFSGHSDEGYYFDLARLFPKDPNPLPRNKYQIMFFNSCTTYSYYKRNFFAAKKTRTDKKGTKNLDLLTNGIGAPFTLEKNAPAEIETSDTILIRTLMGLNKKGRRERQLLSWQEILDKITRNAGYDYTALTNIKGDEDNPDRVSLPVPAPRL